MNWAARRNVHPRAILRRSWRIPQYERYERYATSGSALPLSTWDFFRKFVSFVLRTRARLILEDRWLSAPLRGPDATKRDTPTRARDVRRHCVTGRSSCRAGTPLASSLTRARRGVNFCGAASFRFVQCQTSECSTGCPDRSLTRGNRSASPSPAIAARDGAGS